MVSSHLKVVNSFTTVTIYCILLPINNIHYGRCTRPHRAWIMCCCRPVANAKLLVSSSAIYPNLLHFMFCPADIQYNANLARLEVLERVQFQVAVGRLRITPGTFLVWCLGVLRMKTLQRPPSVAHQWIEGIKTYQSLCNQDTWGIRTLGLGSKVMQRSGVTGVPSRTSFRQN